MLLTVLLGHNCQKTRTEAEAERLKGITQLVLIDGACRGREVDEDPPGQLGTEASE